MIAHKTKAAMPGRLSHNALLKHSQITRLAAGGQTLSRRNSYAQFNCVRLTYGHSKLLKLIQSPNSGSAQESHNPLKLPQTGNLHSAQNTQKSLSQLDYNESLELASNKHEQYSGSPEHQHCLGSEVSTNSVESCGDDGKYHHEENHKLAVLHRNPDLAYERAVPQSHEVNRLSLSESDSLPTDSGLVRHLCETQRPAQNNPEIIEAVGCRHIWRLVHSANETSPVQAKKKGRISAPKQTTENPVVTYKIFVGQLSDSDLAFLRCSSLRFLKNDSRANSTGLKSGCSGDAFLGFGTIGSFAMRQPSESSFAFLRCRRLISPLIEATTKPAVLSPSSFTFSSSPINSNGTLETICCDLLFLEPVAMSAFPFDWWHSVYAKINHNQGLKVAFTLLYGKCMPPVRVRHKWQRPRVLGTTTEASNHNVIGANTMAGSQHTQTRPKYQYRSLALSAIGRNVIHITVTTEREAREQSPAGCVMVFAGRLPVREGRHA